MKKCPNCDVVMNEVIKVNVLIDVCPKCMGIWLDKGKLENLFSQLNNNTNNSYRNDGWNDHQEHHDDDDHHYNKHGGYKGKRRFGDILGNLFD